MISVSVGGAHARFPLLLLLLLGVAHAGIADRVRAAALAAAKVPFEPLRAPLEVAFAGLRQHVTGAPGSPSPATRAALLAKGFASPLDADAQSAPWFAPSSTTRGGQRTVGAVAYVFPCRAPPRSSRWQP